MSKVLTNEIEPKSGDKITTDKYLQQKGLPHVRVGGSSGSYTAHSADDAIKNNIVVSGDATMYNTSTYTFTIPVDGVYLLTANVLVDGANSLHIDIYKNGTRIFRGGGSATSERMFQTSVSELFTANDTIQFKVNQADSYLMDTVHNWATVTLLG